jgi:hypothetical protein
MSRERGISRKFECRETEGRSTIHHKPSGQESETSRNDQNSCLSQRLGKESKAMSHTETQGSQRKCIHDVYYLKGFRRICIPRGRHQFEGRSRSCDCLKVTPSKAVKDVE